MFGKIKKQANRRLKAESSGTGLLPKRFAAFSSKRDWMQFRLGAVAAVFVLLWGLLWLRAWDLQIMQGPRLAEKAARLHKGTELRTGSRGPILDRNGQILVRSVEVHSVFARPHEVENVSDTSAKLAKMLNLPQKQIQTQLSSSKSFVWLKRKVDDLVASEIKEAKLKGIELAAEYIRVYPFKQLAGQLLGFVDIDDHGLEGVEKAFDRELNGHFSRVEVQRDAAGRGLYLSGTEDEGDLEGRPLELTIDMQIQYFTEEALAKAVTQYDAKWGGCLVIDVPTGEIIAWAEYPFFNPNATRDNMSPRAWRARLATDALEQGSTVKPILVAAALTEKRIKSSNRYYCEQGKWERKKYTIRDTHGHGWLSVSEIIQYSSNIGAAKIGLEMGASLFHRYLSGLGYGQKTGLPVMGESAGILRNPNQWAEVDLAAASFGQSFSATALQMGEAYLTIASGGVKRSLKLVKDANPDDGANQRIFSAEACHSVLDMLHDVVEEDGTGQRARIPGISVGGKTGTAQKARAGTYGSGRVSSFIGVAPLDNPKYLVVTMVDEPQKNSYGGVVAAPVFRHVVSRALAYRGELPDSSALGLDDVVPAQNSTASTGKGNNTGAGAAEAKKASGKGMGASYYLAVLESAQEISSKNLGPATGLAVSSSNGKGSGSGVGVGAGVGAGAGAGAGAGGSKGEKSRKAEAVPDVVGKSVRSAMEEFMSAGLTPVLKGKGYIVIRQDPEAGSTLSYKSGNLNSTNSTLWLSEHEI